MEYEIHLHAGFIEVVTHGGAEVAVFQEFLDEVLALKEWKPATPFLNDHSDLDAGPLTVNDISAIAEMFERAKVELGSSRLAVLVSRDLEYGLARMWNVFVEEKWDGIGQVFRSREDAVHWLTQF